MDAKTVITAVGVVAGAVVLLGGLLDYVEKRPRAKAVLTYLWGGFVILLAVVFKQELQGPLKGAEPVALAAIGTFLGGLALVASGYIGTQEQTAKAKSELKNLLLLGIPLLLVIRIAGC